MKRSMDRICTTHVGSLARPPVLLDLMRAAAQGGDYDPGELAAAVSWGLKHAQVPGCPTGQHERGLNWYPAHRCGIVIWRWMCS